MKDSNAITSFNGMTREEKDLVLQDLCGRLPYEVKCRFEDTIRIIDGESSPCYDSVLSAYHLEIFIRLNDFYIKPYLRPMSSMTEEEIIEFNNIPSTKNYTIIENDLPWDVAHYKQIEWLNKKMFDYRGLIPKDLALSTDEYNPYKD